MENERYFVFSIIRGNGVGGLVINDARMKRASYPSLQDQIDFVKSAALENFGEVLKDFHVTFPIELSKEDSEIAFQGR